MSYATVIGLPQIHLSPGELLVTRQPQVVVTVLGSCVAVTMFARQASLAAICHAMMAQPQATEGADQACDQPFRYVSHVLPAMFATYRREGIALQSIEVKVFGGANLIAHANGAPGAHWVGGANLAAVRTLLERARLTVSAENTGGSRGRKILFNTATGEVLHKHLRTTPHRP